MYLLLKSAKTAGAVVAVSSFFLADTCLSNPELPSVLAAPSATPSEESLDTTGSIAGFMGTPALPESIQNSTPAAVKDAVGSYVESDDPKPIIFDSESAYGFTYVTAVGDGDAAMLSTAGDPATISQINEKAESAENYMPYELPGEHAFSGVNRGSPFATVIDEDNRTHQESVFANIDADAAQSLIDEITQDFQQS